MSDPIRKLAEEIVTKVLGEAARVSPATLCNWTEVHLRSALPELARERDRLWCAAVVATQEGRGRGRMVCDVETLTRWFNEHREDGGELHFGTPHSPDLSVLLGELAVAREALRKVSTAPSTVEVGETYCPSCLRRSKYGHREDCEIEAALFSDAGRLASELIRAAVAEQLLEKSLLCEPGELAASGGLEPAAEAWKRRRAAVDALLSAFPGIREEVERGD